jgi:hypothetical protein
VPPVCAEQPPLSAVPVEHVRDVDPLESRDRVKVAAFASRFDVTTIV